MAYYRIGDTESARNSVEAILNFANIWRMDNPLTNFGANVGIDFLVRTNFT